VSEGLEAACRALAGEQAWLVGGAVRDELLGRETADYDIVIAGDTARAAKAVAKAAGRAACFPLSEEFGSWRVSARDGSWQVDVEALRGASLEEDLSLRDFTVNAIARPLGGGEPIDPLGGREDLRAGCLRAAGPSSFSLDPLRVLRLVRIAVELDVEPDQQTLREASSHAPELARVSGERIFVELRRTLATPAARRGIELTEQVGAAAVVLPELEALRGVEQSRYHHADVHEHTLQVLERSVELTSATNGPKGPLAELGEHRLEVERLLAEPLADQMSRGEALRWGALLHDIAKPQTRAVGADGRVTFMGHDRQGDDLAREILRRLRTSERLRAHVAALVRNHLRLGFLVHRPQPLDRRTVYGYLKACEPVEVDVTVLSMADRLATLGAGSEKAVAAHLHLAREMLGDALAWRAQGRLAPLLRGDRMAEELGIVEGPVLGELLEEIAQARYAGELDSPEQALERAHELLRRRREDPAAEAL
jgi:poly(A) polymerase